MKNKKISLFVILSIVFLLFNSNVYAEEWPIEKYKNSTEYDFKVSNQEQSDDTSIKGTFTTEYVDKNGEFGDPGYIINYGTSIAKQVVEYTFALPADYASLRNFTDTKRIPISLPDSDLMDESRASADFQISASFLTYKNEEELENTIESVLPYDFKNCNREETNIEGKRAIKFTAEALREPTKSAFGNLEYKEKVIYFVFMDQLKINGASLILDININGGGVTTISAHGGATEAHEILMDYYNWHVETDSQIIRELVNGDFTYKLQSFNENGEEKNTAVGSTNDDSSNNSGIVIGVIVGGVLIGGGTIITHLKNKKTKNKNNEPSEYSKKVQNEYKESIAKAKHDLKMDRMKYKHGLDKDATEKDIKKHLVGERVKNEVEFQEQLAKEGNLAAAQNIAENVESAADYAIAVGEAAVPGGKAVSAAYKGIKNVAATTADKGLKSGLTEGVMRGVTEAATTMMDGGLKKASAAVIGETAANVTGATLRGEDIERAAKEGIEKGTVNAGTGVISDTMGDVGGKVGGAIGNVGSTAYSKNISDPKIKEKLDKKNKK